MIASQLIWNCLTAKHDAYAHEREVRFIIMNVTPTFDAHRKTFNGKNCIEVPLPLKSPVALCRFWWALIRHPVRRIWSQISYVGVTGDLRDVAGIAAIMQSSSHDQTIRERPFDNS